MITRSSIAFEDFLGSSIAPQVMPPWWAVVFMFIMNNYESALQTGLNSKNFIKENQSVANFEFGYKKLIDLVSI